MNDTDLFQLLAEIERANRETLEQFLQLQPDDLTLIAILDEIKAQDAAILKRLIEPKPKRKGSAELTDWNMDELID